MYPLATKPGFKIWKLAGLAAGVVALALAGYIFLRPADTPFTRAVALIRSGKAAAAIPILEDLSRQHPDDAAVFPWLAQGYLATERLGEGRTALDTALKVKLPTREVVPVVLAYAAYYQGRGDYEESEKLLQSAEAVYSAAELNNGRANLYLNWADNSAKSGDLKGALVRLESALSLASAVDEPLKSAIPHRLSEHYRQLAAVAEIKEKNDKEAIALLQKSLSVADEPATRMALGNIYARQGKADQAIECYQQVSALDPNNLESRHRLVELLVQAKNFRKAQEALLELTDKERSVENYQLLASLNLKLGLQGNAVRALEDATDLRPKDPGLLRQLEVVLLDWSASLAKQGKVPESMSVKGHAERVHDMLSMLVKKDEGEEKKEEEEEKPAEQSAEAVQAAETKPVLPPWDPKVPPITLCASHIWLAKGSFTPEGEISIKNISGRPITDLSLTVVFYDNTAKARKGTISLPVATPTSVAFAAGAMRSLYFSCPNIVKPDHHLAAIIFWKGRLLKELPCMKQ